MAIWTLDSLKSRVEKYDLLDQLQRIHFLREMNLHFPPSVFETQITQRRQALQNSEQGKILLTGATQEYPPFVQAKKIETSGESMRGVGVVFTAGGEGERLRLSLLSQGVAPSALKDFTKATFPLTDFLHPLGSIHINLAVISSFCKKYSIDIPVVITTGPPGSTTEKVIPKIVEENQNFGLKNLKIVPQEQRLHFTMDEKVAFTINDGLPYPVTQPDETGGPLMKLKQKPDSNEPSCIEWLQTLGCTKIILAQATALYEKNLLPVMAQAAKNHDCLGVGILRENFPPQDPFGTFVSVKKKNTEITCIIEQGIRNDTTRTVKDPQGKFFLPFNTGLYAIDCSLLKENDLPDYATPPKEVRPDLERSPKIGYAATDILPLGKSPLILTVDPKMYAVIKTADDLSVLSQAAKRFGLLEICREVILNCGVEKGRKQCD